MLVREERKRKSGVPSSGSESERVGELGEAVVWEAGWIVSSEASAMLAEVGGLVAVVLR